TQVTPPPRPGSAPRLARPKPGKRRGIAAAKRPRHSLLRQAGDLRPVVEVPGNGIATRELGCAARTGYFSFGSLLGRRSVFLLHHILKILLAHICPSTERQNISARSLQTIPAPRPGCACSTPHRESPISRAANPYWS